MTLTYCDACLAMEFEIGGYGIFDDYAEFVAKESGRLGAFARASNGCEMVEFEASQVEGGEIAALFGRAGVVVEELAWRLYDAESGELLDEASTLNGRFIQIDSGDFRTLEKFERWLFPALEALAVSRERRELAKASEEGKAAGRTRRGL